MTSMAELCQDTLQTLRRGDRPLQKWGEHVHVPAPRWQSREALGRKRGGQGCELSSSNKKGSVMLAERCQPGVQSPTEEKVIELDKKQVVMTFRGNVFDATITVNSLCRNSRNKMDGIT